MNPEFEMFSSALFAAVLAVAATSASQASTVEQAKPAIQPLRVIPDPERRPFSQDAKTRFFQMWDTDGDGFASASELNRGFARPENEPSPSIRFLEERDTDRDGRLSLEEVLSHPMGTGPLNVR